ncbi:lipoyl(octanoyl) transferase [Seinonella peptonophila]|uniref:Octanoyltransferase n=1 Tax=Seinonella peptonophila TaxID=112248 RepID=A0A1M4TKZ3_9BACL|nr:lipoyl(octanoyl) transferase LipB [Seinonella peptonophila]SHE45098.1 lipoyl(octanoyl) transferase [Seinonella peptonophila]
MLHEQRFGIIPYHEAWSMQREWVQKVDDGAENQLILLQHPHTITLGRTTDQKHLLLTTEEYCQRQIEVVEIDRGGDVTYHGPGQLVGYPILYLGEQRNLARSYLRQLEQGLIDALSFWGIVASRREKYTGVWVGKEKIAAIGVKFHRGRHRRGYISSHGFALNVNTELKYFETIVPCGITQYGVTSMEKILKVKIEITEVMHQVKKSFDLIFSQ